ncbi:MAG: glycosyltransferase [Candidatus Hodarchaeales archaeon]
METNADIVRYRELLQKKVSEDKIVFLGSGYESVLFTDYKVIYKVLYKWRPEWYPFLSLLIKRFQNCKRLINLKNFYSIEDIHVLEYDYFESTPYKGNREDEIIEFLVECRNHGIISRDVKPGNFRLTKTGLKYVDYGWDIKPFNQKDFLFMVQRAFLTLKYYHRENFKLLARKTITQWNVPELAGFNEFFNRVYNTILKQKGNSVITNPINAYNEINLSKKINDLILEKKGRTDISLLCYRGNKDRSLIIENINHIPCKITDSFDNYLKDKYNFIVMDLIDRDVFLEKHFNFLKELRSLLMDDSNIIIVIDNPFFHNSKIEHPITYLRRKLLYSGFLIDSIEESTYQIDMNGCYYSDSIIIKAVPAKFLDHNVSLVIKTCYQDAATIDRQIRHIVNQCEYPEIFCEKIVIIDPKEDDFLRQYSNPDKEKLYSILNDLKNGEVITDFYTAPDNTKEIEKINYVWFSMKTRETHDVRNIPVVPQLYAFEKARGQYILQMDSDVIIVRRDLKHNYLKDMIRALEKDTKSLSVSFNIAHPSEGKFIEYSSPQGGEFVPEVRFCLIHRDRFFSSRPFPNTLVGGKLKLSWYRSVYRLQKDKGLVSLRGGDPRSFYIHPPNTKKSDISKLFSIVDRAESSQVPKIQFENNDLVGDSLDWAIPKRNEQYIFIICGRNVSPRKFKRCWKSVVEQEKKNWGAIIIDDASTNNLSEYIDFQTHPFQEKVTFLRNYTRHGVLHNIYTAIRSYCTNKFSIILILDADDMLLSKNVLNALDRIYLTGTNATVGTMLRSDKGIITFIPNFVNPRNERNGDVWMHLRTFRKYLFDNISENDFKIEGEWIDKFTELTYMVPIIEMATRPAHLNWPVYFYEPSQKRTVEHYKKNKKTRDHINSLSRYKKFTLKDEIKIRPLGELLFLLKDRNIVIIRHAETENHRQDNLGFLKDDSLVITESSKENCFYWGSILPFKIDLIITSSTKRTQQTAELIRDGNDSECNIIQIPELRGVQKINISKWNKLIKKNGYLTTIEQWINGNMADDIVTPYDNYIKKLIHSMKSNIETNDAENILVITHDHVVRNMVYFYFNILESRIPYLNGFVINDF